MTATDVSATTRSDERRTGWWVGGAVGVIVLTLALILGLGFVPLPSVVDASTAPDPTRTGDIALLVQEEESWCLVVVAAADGAAREVACEDGWGDTERLAWTTDGMLAIVAWSWERERPVPVDVETRLLRVYDPVDGRLVDEVEVAADAVPTAPWPTGEERDGQRLELGRQPDGQAELVLIAADGTATTLLALDGPRDYRFDGARFSPDGTWVLVQDSRGRTLAVPSAGGDPVLLYAAGRDAWLPAAPAWRQPGTTANLLDLDTLTP